MHKILIVEDDPALRRVLGLLFETNGFRVVMAETCELGVRQAQTHRPDVCVLDLGLPDEDGVNFIHKVRAWSPVGIIVLSARDAEVQRVAAFDAGADDYVLKPFSTIELVARARAIMRRAARSEQPQAVLRFGHTLVNLGTRQATGPRGEEIHFTPLEHRILECLARHCDGVVTHAQMLKEVWGPHQADMRSLRVYIASLRRKLEVDPTQPRHLVTESGIGYRLMTDGEEPAAIFNAFVSGSKSHVG